MRHIVAVVTLLSFVAGSGCSTTRVSETRSGAGLGKSGVFIEPNFPRESLNIRRVAIIPNRLPANLLDPEKWRVQNFATVRKAFESRGFEVIDYDTTIAAFERSGLPVEDTKNSREKFAEFCQALGVDAVIVPYYGTFAWSTTVLLLSTAHFAAVSSFQIYLADRNDFLARIDTSAEVAYTTGGLTIAGLATVIIGALIPPPTPSVSSTGRVTSGGTNVGQILSYVGLGLVAVDALISGLSSAKAPDGYWEEAFVESIQKGLSPFFDVIRASAGGAARPPPSFVPGARTPGYAPAPAPYQPAPAPYQPAPSPYQQPAAPYQPAPAPYQPAPAPYQPAPTPYQPAPTPYQPAPAPYQPAPAPYPGPTAPARGCVADGECKGGRVCVQGQCVAPTAPPPPSPAAGCTTSADCAAGRICLQGQCL